MSGNRLQMFHIISDGDMSSGITSDALGIEFFDNIGVQLNFTGSPVGSFEIQVSNDHEEDSQGNIIVAGNWIALTLSPDPVASGSANQIYIDMNQLSAPYLRIKYTWTSGSGTLNAYASAKMV